MEERRGRDGGEMEERWRGFRGDLEGIWGRDGGGEFERKAEKVSPCSKKAEKICVCQKKAVSLQTILESEDKFDCLRPL